MRVGCAGADFVVVVAVVGSGIVVVVMVLLLKVRVKRFWNMEGLEGGIFFRERGGSGDFFALGVGCGCWQEDVWVGGWLRAGSSRVLGSKGSDLGALFEEIGE